MTVRGSSTPANFNLQRTYGYTADYSDTYLIALGATNGGINGSGNSGSGNSSTTTRYEQHNPAVQYKGSWYQNNGSLNSAGNAAMAMEAGTKATFTFTGTSAKWIGFSDPWSGIATVSVDGVQKATIDTYAATQTAQRVQYTIGNLTSGTHTLTITATGEKNSSSGGAWIWVDAFDVINSELRL